MHQSVLKTITCLCLVVVLQACATKKNTFGGSVKAEGKAVTAIGKKWEKGQAMIKKGNSLVRKGNKQIADGEENVADGKAMTTTGKKLVEDAEAEYAKLNVAPPTE